jgi:Calcineurin-like phosphoesterase superfamily domain
VKLLILSDIHGNLDALHAIRESYDELWVLGDIVNYGPEPREALEAVRATASIVVQGNHDHAVGHCDDSRWSARFREVAEATRRFTSSQLSAAQKAYLRSFSSCSVSLMLVPFGLVATFDPGVTLLPAMYSPTNGTDHRKLDSG